MNNKGREEKKKTEEKGEGKKREMKTEKRETRLRRGGGKE